MVSQATHHHQSHVFGHEWFRPGNYPECRTHTRRDRGGAGGPRHDERDDRVRLLWLARYRLGSPQPPRPRQAANWLHQRNPKPGSLVWPVQSIEKWRGLATLDRWQSTQFATHEGSCRSTRPYRAARALRRLGESCTAELEGFGRRGALGCLLATLGGHRTGDEGSASSSAPLAAGNSPVAGAQAFKPCDL